MLPNELDITSTSTLMKPYTMTAEERAAVQDVYDKAAKVEALADEALTICTDLREDDPIRDNEDKKSPMALINMLLQIESGLESVTDEIPMLRMRLVNDFGATPHSPSNIHPVRKSPLATDPTDTLLAAFKQLKLDKKNEMLKRLIDCQREPATGPDPVEVVMTGFRQLTEKEKKEMLKRMIDCE